MLNPPLRQNHRSSASKPPLSCAPLSLVDLAERGELKELPGQSEPADAFDGNDGLLMPAGLPMRANDGG